MPSYRVVTLSSGKPLQAGACQGQSLCLEDLSGSNGENGLGAVRLEAYCRSPAPYHETPELESSSQMGKAVQG